MVAWERQIEEHCVPAWRDKYVAYARLKRKLERIVPAAPEGSAEAVVPGTFERKWTPCSGDNLLEAKQALLNPAESCEHQEFMSEVQAELDRVSRWYSETVTALESRVRQLVDRPGSPGNTVGLATAANCNYRRSLSPQEEIAELHLQAVQLTEYVLMNSEALRKIVKKMDKQCGTKYQKDFVERHLKKSPLASPPGTPNTPFYGERARACRRSLEDLVSPEIVETLRSRAMNFGAGAGLTKMSFRPRRTLVSAALALLAEFLARPAFPAEEIRARRCIILVGFIVSMWVLEAAPFEATALLVAPIAVLLSVLEGEKQAQAEKILGSVFNDSLYVVLGGFVMSSVFSRCQLDCRAAAWLQRVLGHRPFLFMLAIMFLGTGLSALVSNVTAPLLLLEVLKPLLRDLPTDCRYSRALLLGLSFSCNIGGMITPISSPQNIAALQTLRLQGGNISWAQWLLVSIPFCAVMEMIAWALLLVHYHFDRSEAEAKRDAETGGKDFRIPPVEFEREEMTQGKVLALAGASATLGIFACTPIAKLLGGTSMVAMLFVAVMLYTGFISRQTFNSYSWHLLFLIGGGNALGLAVRDSGLLAVLTVFAHEGFASTPWLLVAELILVLVGATTFVSHTVSALVLMPLVVDLGTEAGVEDMAVLLGALACSAACALPMTSFPNVNSLCALDDNGKPWLSVRHFLIAGTPMTVATTTMLVAVGIPLAGLAVGLNT